MNNKQKNINTKGTSQIDRFPKALDFDFAKLDERSKEDIVRQTYKLAECVNFYGEENLTDGDWKEFFNDIFYNDTLNTERIAEYNKNGSAPPHLGLYLSFLKLFTTAQDELNNITKRHLDYFYKEILKFQHKDYINDRVHLFFELNKNENQVLIPKRTLFDAGNDKNGNKLHYSSDYDLVANKSKIESIKKISVKTNKSDEKDIRINFEKRKNIIEDKSEQFASIGFVISSPLFYLKEGRRRISLEFNKEISFLDNINFSIQYTTIDGWQNAQFKVKDNFLLLKITQANPPMEKYNNSVHGLNLATEYPTLKFSIATNKENLLSASDYQELTKLCVKDIIRISVNVNGVRDLILQNDYGKIDCNKPFTPFGAIPVYNKSEFYIGNSKIFNQYLDSFNININWKGLPGNIGKYYDTYKGGLSLLDTNQLSINKTFKIDEFYNVFSEGKPPGKVYILDGGEWVEYTVNKYADYKEKGNNNHPKTRAFYRNVIKVKNIRKLNPFDFINEKPIDSYSSNVKNGFIKIVSGYDYGHNLYQSLLSKVLIHNTLKKSDDQEDLVTPEKPYTPEFQSVQIDYRASDNMNLENHEVFVLHPFGNHKIEDKKENIFPIIIDNHKLTKGQIDGNSEVKRIYYFGVSNIDRELELNLYLEIDDTSSSYNVNKQRSQNTHTWSFLSGKKWTDFDNINIVRDTTTNLNKSGLVAFKIHDNALQTHTLLDPGLLWLRLSIDAETDTYPEIVNAITNCVTATFENHDNELSHLDKGLQPDTIKKFVNNLQGIKAVTQPYVSYGGKNRETENNYYTRVSERIRHKNRAWTTWDYERLILENFPQIVYARCTSTSSENNDYQPGSVKITLSPDCKLVNQKDKYKPEVPKRVLNDIRSFLDRACSPFINIDLCNFKYKEMKVFCEVRLRNEFSDSSFYRDKINTSLIEFIAPWISNKENILAYKTKNVGDIYFFLENLEYVDYIKSAYVEIDGKAFNLSDKLIIDNPNNTLITSATAHDITII